MLASGTGCLWYIAAFFCSLLWPATLGAWLLMGRPDPTYLFETQEGVVRQLIAEFDLSREATTRSSRVNPTTGSAASNQVGGRRRRRPAAVPVACSSFRPGNTARHVTH
jgi:hypothetical protein